VAVSNTKDSAVERRPGRPGASRRAGGVGALVKSKSRCVLASGLALTVGAGVLVVDTAAASAATPTTAAASATPGVTASTITVGSISDISAPIAGLFEGAKVGTQAYFAMINSQGGVNGRKLVLNGMDSAFSSGTVSNDAKNIAANDFAFVGGFSLLDGAEQPAIDAGKVPIVTQVLTPSLYTDPNLYSAIPLVNGGEATGPFKWIKSQYPTDIKGVGVIGSNSAATAITAEHTFHNLTSSLGYKWVYDRDASFTETSFLPDMIKMKNAGVKLLFEPTQQGAYISTMAQENKQEGLDALLLSGANAYEAGFDPGSAGNGTLVTTVSALYMGQDAKVIPAVATFDKWAKKVDPQTQLDLYTLYGWINAQLFVQALKGAGANPTRASLDAQLNKITSFNASGLISNQNPAQKIPGQCWIVAEYENGTWKRIPPDPKAGFVCKPGGFYPSSYKGISR
jgi:branched-chain amino acid transport system substrate-binding protein